MSFKSIRDMDFKGKRVIVRADLNVPAENGKVTDTTRIDRLKDTIDLLRQKNARVIVASHFGRPKGPSPDTSLKFMLPVLEKQWGAKIAFAEDCIGDKVKTAVDAMKNGDVTVLENLRFHPGEEKNDDAFAQKLAANGDVFVNDAFSVSHREAASLVAITKHLPAAAGLLMEEELVALDKALGSPEKPVAAIIGGSKISTKLDVLTNVVKKVDFLILGGGMANTFLHAKGFDVGSSLCEKDMAEKAREIMQIAQKSGCEIILPVDGVTVTKLEENAAHTVNNTADGIPAGRSMVDVGPHSIQHVKDILSRCKTVLWNGPLGVFEIRPFEKGTFEVARHAAKLTKGGKLTSIGGGGDTGKALNDAGASADFTYVSTAGGAFMESIEGKALPGVAALYSSRL